MDNQVVHLNANSRLILIDFMSRTTGFLRYWWQSLKEYMQLQFLSFPLNQALSEHRIQFLGKSQPKNNRIAKIILQ